MQNIKIITRAILFNQQNRTIEHSVRRMLIFLFSFSVSIAIFPVNAQQPAPAIEEIRQQIEKFEEIDKDVKISPEIRLLNQKLLQERKNELSQLLIAKIVDIREYLTRVGSALKPDQKNAIDNSIREIEFEIQKLTSNKNAAAQSIPDKISTASLALTSTKDQRQPVILNNQTSIGQNLLTENPDPAAPTGRMPTSSESKIPIPNSSRQQGSERRNKKKDLIIDVAAEQLTGEKIRGPVEIELRNVNNLRYDIRIGQETTFLPAPDLKLPFIPSIPTKTASAAPPEVKSSSSVSSGTIPRRFKDLRDKLITIENDSVSDVQTPIINAINSANKAKSFVESLVSTSDSVLASSGTSATGGATALIRSIPSVIAEINTATGKSYPDSEIERLIGELNELELNLLTLPGTQVGPGDTTWQAWSADAGNKSSYDAVLARTRETRTFIQSINRNSQQATQLRESQNKLSSWRTILAGVEAGGTGSFTREVKAGCGSAFDTGKETKVKLTKRDRLAEPTVAPTSEEIVTVVCSSPFSVSAGFGFSGVREREFIFVPSTKTVTANGQTTEQTIKRFGFKSQSSFRTLPVILLNTRIYEPNDTVAVHLSTGAAVDIKTGQGGTDLEFIVGPSFSFKRSFFLTTGFHIGRVSRLAGGFQIDQEVPQGISEPPLEKSWNIRPSFVFTYKIR